MKTKKGKSMVHACCFFKMPTRLLSYWETTWLWLLKKVARTSHSNRFT